MQHLTTLAQRQKAPLLYGYRITVRYPSTKPYPTFHNTTVFSKTIPQSWYELPQHEGVAQADLFRSGKLVARYTRGNDTPYQSIQRNNKRTKLKAVSILKEPIASVGMIALTQADIDNVTPC